MLELPSITKRTSLGYKGTMLNKRYNFSFSEVYKLDDDHILIYEKASLYAVYAVSRISTNKVTLVLSVYPRKNHEMINVVEASNKNIFPAVKLYEFLIKKLGKTLVTSQQSVGGKILWSKLSKVKGITVNGWDFKKDVPINTDKYLTETDDIYVEQNLSRYHKDIANICLVASAKNS